MAEYVAANMEIRRQDFDVYMRVIGRDGDSRLALPDRLVMSRDIYFQLQQHYWMRLLLETHWMESYWLILFLSVNNAQIHKRILK